MGADARRRDREQTRVADNKKFNELLTLMKRVPEYSPYGVHTTNRTVRHFLNVANRLIGNLDVVHLTDEQMMMATRERGLPQDTPSFYDRPTDRIIVSQSAMRGVDRNSLLIHELAHPIMEAAAQSAKMRPIINRLDEQRAALQAVVDDPQHPAHDAVIGLIGRDPHGLLNVHEFFSELWSNKDFARALHEVQISDALRDRWKTGSHETLLDATLHDIRQGLSDMFFNVSRMRLLNDSSIASLDLLRHMEEHGRPGVYGWVCEGGAPRPCGTSASVQGREGAKRGLYYPLSRSTTFSLSTCALVAAKVLRPMPSPRMGRSTTSTRTKLTLITWPACEEPTSIRISWAKIDPTYTSLSSLLVASFLWGSTIATR